MLRVAYVFSVVGMARCAVRAASSGATRDYRTRVRFASSARYCAGGDIAARCPYHAKHIPGCKPALLWLRLRRAVRSAG